MTAAIAYGVGQRTAVWLRNQWPTDTAKRAARALNTEPRTVKTWLAGNPPSNEYFHAMVAQWGKAFLAFVYQPHFDWTEQARLDVELETALASLEEIRERLRSRNESTQRAGGQVLSMETKPAAEKSASVARANHKVDRSAS